MVLQSLLYKKRIKEASFIVQIYGDSLSLRKKGIILIPFSIKSTQIESLVLDNQFL